MSVHFWLSALTAFLACGVEAVEALTIVLAVGHSRSWRSSLGGALWATVILAAIVAVFGPLLHFVPIRFIELAAGAVALYFGQGWLRKAILRSSGRKAMRDENAIYEREIRAVHDRGAFATSFNGVFVEGVEVVVIVISLGTVRGGGLIAAVTGALIAILAVILLGIVLRKPAAQVPENLMKTIVGVMLCSFGTFWVLEGAGFPWWHGDISIVLLAAFFAAIDIISVAALRRRPASV